MSSLVMWLSAFFPAPFMAQQVEMLLLHTPGFEGSVGKDAEQPERLISVSKPSSALLAAGRGWDPAETTLGVM